MDDAIQQLDYVTGLGLVDGQSIKRLGLAKLYFVTSGRNAWWATWIKRYEEGCMQAKLRSAQQQAERRRTNGSVFYIRELPALFIEKEHALLIVTQINTEHVLGSYRPSGVALNKGQLSDHMDEN